MESLSSLRQAVHRAHCKPDVDFVFGLAPVISIEQKTLTSIPRSTVGTMTDIASYLNLLLQPSGAAWSADRRGDAKRTASQIPEAILAAPRRGGNRAARAAREIYGEELEVVFTEVRKKAAGD